MSSFLFCGILFFKLREKTHFAGKEYIMIIDPIVLKEGNELSFETYAQLASARSAKFVKEVVKAL